MRESVSLRADPKLWRSQAVLAPKHVRATYVPSGLGTQSRGAFLGMPPLDAVVEVAVRVLVDEAGRDVDVVPLPRTVGIPVVPLVAPAKHTTRQIAHLQ